MWVNGITITVTKKTIHTPPTLFIFAEEGLRGWKINIIYCLFNPLSLFFYFSIRFWFVFVFFFSPLESQKIFPSTRLNIFFFLNLYDNCTIAFIILFFKYIYIISKDWYHKRQTFFFCLQESLKNNIFYYNQLFFFLSISSFFEVYIFLFVLLVKVKNTHGDNYFLNHILKKNSYYFD